ncbi:MAG TPA: TonB family protein [Sulfurovum sp.]|uniref:energy transducer TonB n=1 Tax=Sulfurovum sp. TaxID=1969726 RepID=UPI002F95BE1E
MFFYLQDHYFVSSEKAEEKEIQLCMCSFTPEVVTLEEQQVEETEEQKEPVTEEEPVVEEKPTVEPETVKEAVQEPIQEPIKEPVKEKEHEVEKKVIPEPVVEKPVPKPTKKTVEKKKKTQKKTVVKKKQSQQKASPQRSKGSSAEKNLFLANIREKINKHKSYPRIAQRRGMQGTVTVKFTILGNGNVGNISVSGPKVFHTSARNAVKSAFPVDAKSAPISLPKSVSITLHYQIR